MQRSIWHLWLLIGWRQDNGWAELLCDCIEKGCIMSAALWGNEALISHLCLWSSRPKAIGFRSGCVDSALLGPQSPLGAKHRLLSPSSFIYMVFPWTLCLYHTSYLQISRLKETLRMKKVELLYTVWIFIIRCIRTIEINQQVWGEKV